MLACKGGGTLPGWRDFERAVAAVFSGEASESKSIFDVTLFDAALPRVRYGLSCKMRRELDRILRRDGRATIELSNSAGAFWDELRARGIDSTYRDRPAEVGEALVDVVRRWHRAADLSHGGHYDLSRSSFLLLSWNLTGLYQLHQFPLELPDPASLHWYFPSVTRSGVVTPGRRLRGDDGEGCVFEWYESSGGQLKYYPHSGLALWSSIRFHLAPLPELEFEMLAKAKAYFMDAWAATEEERSVPPTGSPPTIVSKQRARG